jgi:hypothetical protein
MATLKTNTLTGTSTAGSIAVTGEGNSTTTNLQQGLAKSWINFNGAASTVTTRDSFNITGVTDNSAGDYTIATANDMSNANYCITVCYNCNDYSADRNGTDQDDIATGQYRRVLVSTGVALQDNNYVSSAVHGDLA